MTNNEVVAMLKAMADTVGTTMEQFPQGYVTLSFCKEIDGHMIRFTCGSEAVEGDDEETDDGGLAHEPVDDEEDGA